MVFTLLGIGIVSGIFVIVLLWQRSSSLRIRRDAIVAQNAAQERHDKQVSDLELRIRDLEMDLEKSRQNNVDLETRAAALQAKMDEQQKQNEYIRSQMSNNFKLLAEEVLTSHGEKFSRQNRQQVGELLKPLAEKITEFQKQTYEGSAALAEQMKTLTKNSLRMSEEATNLTRALKGNSQTQGAWGEMILASILEKSGLKEGVQYLKQQSHRSESGTMVRTDVEVLFPNDDRLIVDSKVSLTAFEAYSNSDDEAERKKYLGEHIVSLRSHIKNLGSKDYHVHSGSTLNYVMMFIPIEGAFSVAFESQPDLIDFAISKNVYITTPTTLMVALRTVANVWDVENRKKNAEEIASRAGLLYDKVAGFLSSMDKMDKSLSAARKSYDEAKGQLTGGPGNVIRQVEMLSELGAKNSKRFPTGWNGGAREDEARNLEHKGSERAEHVPEFLISPDKTPNDPV